MLVADFISNPTIHDLILKKEFEQMFERGKMRRVPYVQPTLQHTIPFAPHHLPFQRTLQVRRARPPVPRPRVAEPVHENVEPQHDDQPIDVVEEVRQDFPDSFVYFSNKGFDQSRFEDYVKDFQSRV